MAFRKLKNCLACNSINLKQVLNLNKQPLANSYITNKESKEKKYELKVNCCLNCNHLQLSIAVNPKEIFSPAFFLKLFKNRCGEKFIL